MHLMHPSDRGKLKLHWTLDQQCFFENRYNFSKMLFLVTVYKRSAAKIINNTHINICFRRSLSLWLDSKDRLYVKISNNLEIRCRYGHGRCLKRPSFRSNCGFTARNTTDRDRFAGKQRRIYSNGFKCAGRQPWFGHG